MARPLLLTVLAFIVSLVAGCKSQEGAAVRGISEDFSLHMKRTACMGRCPVYELYVDAAGVVKYEGYLNVTNVGRFQKTLKPATLRKLSQAIEEADFFSMEKRYDQGIADLPGVELTITQGGTAKSVIARSGAPEALTALHKEVDALIGEEGYEPVEKK